jgi:hypothetical protein
VETPDRRLALDRVSCVLVMLNGLEPRLVVEPEKDPTAAVPAWFVSSPDSFD